VGKGMSRRLSLCLFTSGEQGAEPPAERISPAGHTASITARAAKRTLAVIEAIVCYGFVLTHGTKVSIFPLPSPYSPEADLTAEELFGRNKGVL